MLVRDGTCIIVRSRGTDAEFPFLQPSQLDSLSSIDFVLSTYIFQHGSLKYKNAVVRGMFYL